jgi:hypothetical protein
MNLLDNTTKAKTVPNKGLETGESTKLEYFGHDNLFSELAG